MTNFKIKVSCTVGEEVFEIEQEYSSVECSNMREYATQDTKVLLDNVSRQLSTFNLIESIKD